MSLPAKVPEPLGSALTGDPWERIAIAAARLDDRPQEWPWKEPADLTDTQRDVFRAFQERGWRLDEPLWKERAEEIGAAVGCPGKSVSAHLSIIRKALGVGAPGPHSAPADEGCAATAPGGQPTMGRPSTVTAEKSLEVQEVLRAGGSVQQAAEKIGVHRNTIYYAAKSDTALAKAIQARGIAEDQGAGGSAPSAVVPVNVGTDQEPVSQCPVAVGTKTADTPPAKEPSPVLVALREMQTAFDQFALDVSENCMSSISELNSALRETRSALEKERQHAAIYKELNDHLEKEIDRMTAELERAGLEGAAAIMTYTDNEDDALRLALGIPVDLQDTEIWDRLGALRLAVRALESIASWKPHLRVLLVPAEVKARIEKQDSPRREEVAG